MGFDRFGAVELEIKQFLQLLIARNRQQLLLQQVFRNMVLTRIDLLCQQLPRLQFFFPVEFLKRNRGITAQREEYYETKCVRITNRQRHLSQSRQHQHQRSQPYDHGNTGQECIAIKR